MKVGLVRHFRVKHPFPSPFLVSTQEVVDWFRHYDTAEVENAEVDLIGIDWDRCFTSPLTRSATTASSIFKGNITHADELKELDVMPLLTLKMRLPFLVWAIIVRVASRLPGKVMNDFKGNITRFADELQERNGENILIVSHAFVMIFLQKELRKRGFSGDPFRLPEYGKVYLFEK